MNVQTHLIETLHYVGHVEPRLPIFVHLVEQIVAEQLQDIAIARLWPRRVHLEPVEA